MYVGTAVLYSNKLWSSIPTNRSRIAAIWRLLTTTQFVTTTQLIRRVLYSVSFPIEHIMLCDGENCHLKRNVQFRKQTANEPKLWYDRSKRAKTNNRHSVQHNTKEICCLAIWLYEWLLNESCDQAIIFKPSKMLLENCWESERKSNGQMKDSNELCKKN